MRASSVDTRIGGQSPSLALTVLFGCEENSFTLQLALYFWGLSLQFALLSHLILIWLRCIQSRGRNL
jgi:hypothetical protein